MATFKCSICRTDKPVEDSGGTGYAKRGSRLICYACCATLDKRAMARTGRATMYLTESIRGVYVSNWPGTLAIKTGAPRKGRHNIAGTRTDVWFRFEGHEWHGVQYGNNTQIIHCRRNGARHAA